MSSYYRMLQNFANLNLLTQSEGNISTYPTRGQVVDAPISIVGFDNSVAFGDNSVTRFAYKTNYTPTIGVTYNLSFFIEMEDGLPPVIGDFFLAFNSSNKNWTSSLYLGNIYRVSFSGVSNSGTGFGALKVTTQSARKFKISGIQLTEGADLKPYQKTT